MFQMRSTRVNFFIRALRYYKCATNGCNATAQMVEEFRDMMKKFLAIAFLPPNMIWPEFERQQAEIFKFFKDKVNDGEMIYKKLVDINAFLDYFRTYWLKTVTPEGFSVFGLSKRTNNCCESFNSVLSRDWDKRPVPNDFCPISGDSSGAKTNINNKPHILCEEKLKQKVRIEMVFYEMSKTVLRTRLKSEQTFQVTSGRALAMVSCAFISYVNPMPGIPLSSLVCVLVSMVWRIGCFTWVGQLVNYMSGNCCRKLRIWLDSRRPKLVFLLGTVLRVQAREKKRNLVQLKIQTYSSSIQLICIALTANIERKARAGGWARTQMTRPERAAKSHARVPTQLAPVDIHGRIQSRGLRANPHFVSERQSEIVNLRASEPRQIHIYRQPCASGSCRRRCQQRSRLLRGHTLLASPPELSIRTRCLVPSCECGSRFCRRWQVPQLLCRLHLVSVVFASGATL
ncbi:unnamed protein product [Trichogramma brassicae]|uniref:Uncharacterized protein n=1 Tax=Trichogramma brassicae TaxID=86971 RepID=A0A6H5J110_9HYME|nr:unnamed protein product [Trichogramma brassicae]